MDTGPNGGTGLSPQFLRGTALAELCCRALSQYLPEPGISNVSSQGALVTSDFTQNSSSQNHCSPMNKRCKDKSVPL